MKTQKFGISQVEGGRGIKFILRGHVDSISAAELEQRLNETLKAGEHTIVLNMIRVDYLSSAGIKVILKAFKDAQRAGGDLGIEGPSENVRNVLGMTALDRLLINK